MSATRRPEKSFGKRRFTKSVRQIQENFELVWPNQAYRGSSGVVNTEGEKGAFRKTALGKLSLNLGHYLMDVISQEGSLLPSLSPESRYRITFINLQVVFGFDSQVTL